MELINKIADTLYQNLASKFGEVNIADDSAGAVLESAQARLFDFNYIIEGEKYGPVTISIIDPKNFTIYFAESLSGDLPDSIQRSWFDFLKEMRYFAKKNMMNFDVRNIGKTQLDKRDYEAITKNSSQYTTDEITMESVSKMYGSTKTSYQTVESAKIIVRHRSAVDEDVRGSRSRQIQSIFIENGAKERFKFPYKYLPGARAMARHVNAGGNPHDDLGSHIIECIKEMYELRNFVSKLQKADGFVNEDSADIISDAKKRYKGLKETVATLSKPKGYKLYAENFKPTESIYDESDIDELKGKLIRNVDQTELESLLPTVLKARRKVAEDMGPIHDIIQGKSKIVVTPNEEEDSLIKKQLAFVKANKFKKPNNTQGLDHTENPIHALVRRILATISVRTKDDDLARAIFNIDDSFKNKHDTQMATAIAAKWIKGEVEVQDFDPKYKMKPAEEGFEKWADSVVKEGTWHLPSSNEDVAKFKEIMASPVIAGEEGQAATDEIGEVFGDDELFDDLAELGSKDPNADCRDVINAWLRQTIDRAKGTEHHEYLIRMLGYGDISKELPIEAEAALEEIEAKNSSDMETGMKPGAQKRSKPVPKSGYHDNPYNKGDGENPQEVINSVLWSMKDIFQTYKKYGAVTEGDLFYGDASQEIEQSGLSQNLYTLYQNYRKYLSNAVDKAEAKAGEPMGQDGEIEVDLDQSQLIKFYKDFKAMASKEDSGQNIKEGTMRGGLMKYDGQPEGEHEDAVARYKEFMSQKRPPSEETATMVQGFIFDDELLDSLGDAEEGGDVLDVRSIVQGRLEDFLGDAPFGIDINEAKKSNPEEVLKKGMADALAKELEDEIEDEKDDTDESINHMKHLAGVISSRPKAKKSENQTTPRSIHKRNK